MIHAFSGEHYARNAAKAGDRQPCVICGKPVTSEQRRYVRVDTSNRIHHAACDLAGADMGCFPVGPDCQRKYPQLRALAS